jgi:acetyl/propionyl-CoA carboxylase alpha subunit
MSVNFKVFGKKVNLDPSTGKGWKLTPRPGGWWIAEGPHGVRKRFAFHQEKDQWSGSIGGALWFGTWRKEERSASGSTASAGDSDLVAQFPGKVRKLLVKEGDSVGEGDPLILIEAMKMEFAIKAPYSGKILKLYVEEGTQLSPGSRFLDMEASESGV